MSRRIAVGTLVALGALVVCGCTKDKETEQVTQNLADAQVLYAQQPAAPTQAEPVDPFPAYGSELAADDPVEIAQPPAFAQTVGSRFHVVAKRDTLYSLARLYYNDQARWKSIFEANMDRIADPNKIRIGQRLLIP